MQNKTSENITEKEKAKHSGSKTRMHSFMVASGILASRIAGLIRVRVFAYYFGNSDAADAFNAAFRIPNFLQNLFGEGVLSASFIPVYAELNAKGDHEEAKRVAGAVGGILLFITSILVLIGILSTPVLIALIAPGFSGEKKDLCILLVRIIFPGTAMLVFSAWCLGILNSHGKFFLSYAAGVVLNLFIITSLIIFRKNTEFNLAKWAAWGTVAGSAMQVIIQLPIVIGLLKGITFSLNRHNKNVQTVIKNFIPVFISRGVVQISAYIDSLLASLLGTGAVSALAYAQTLYVLPVSLFGMSVAAAELPAMSKVIGDSRKIADEIQQRLGNGLRQIAFFIIPSAVAFLALGHIIIAALYQTGKFKYSDVLYVWAILGGMTIGLLATTLGRLYSSAFYALKDTRTPLRIAILRVFLTTATGYLASQYLPDILCIDKKWGTVGITATFGLCGWIEFALLRFNLNKRVGKTGLQLSFILKLWLAAAIAALSAWLVIRFTGEYHPVIIAMLVLSAYGIIYFCMTLIFKIPEARLFNRLFKSK